MKKLLFVMAVVATMFASCTPKDEVISPSVTFIAEEPEVDGDVATFSIEVLNYQGVDPVTIPVLVETQAVEGTDYTISATEFVFGGENPVTSIDVTTLVLGTNQTVKLTLQVPSGFVAGDYVESETVLADKSVNVSFETSLVMTEADWLAVKVVVTNAKGAYELENDTEFKVSVNTEKSTAVQGQHFDFESGEDFALVYEGTSEGELYLEILEYAEGKDKIVLRLEETEEFGLGNYFEVEIRLIEFWNKLAGKWAIHEVISTPEFLESMGWWCAMNGWSETETYAGVPELNANDSFEIVINDGNTGKFIPSFQSAFKNYFIGESNMTKGDSYEVYLDGMSLPPVTTMTRIAICDNVNRYFHATDKSDDKEGYVAFGLSYDADLGLELIEMYVVDHTSHSFLPGVLDIPASWGGYAETKPTAYMPGQWIGATFKRVTE